MPRAAGILRALVLVLVACGGDEDEEAFVRDCQAAVRVQCTIDVCFGRFAGAPPAADAGPPPDPFLAPDRELVDLCVDNTLRSNGHCRRAAQDAQCGGRAVYPSSEHCASRAGAPVCTDYCKRDARGTVCISGCVPLCLQQQP